MDPFDKFKKLFEKPKDNSFPNDLDKRMSKVLADFEEKPKQAISNINMNPTGQITGTITNIGAPNANGISYNYTVNSAATTGYVTSAMTGGGTGYYGGVNMGGVSMQAHTPTHVIKYTNHTTGKEIVRVTNEGEVVWGDDIEIDEAAEAFSKALSIGTELKVGITEKVKRDMRDSIFEDIIEIAKQKGSLNAEDLTYLLQAAKIMEKLKGGK